MNLEQLMYIVELEKSKTLTQAAINLNISQSGLSQSINQLEKELGVTLFNRMRQGTTVTKEGREIISQAKEVLNATYELRQTAYYLQQDETASLRLGITNEIPGTLLEVLLEFQKDYPQFKVEMTEALSKDIIEGVKKNVYDMGLIIIDRDNFSLIQDLIFQKIGEGVLKLYMWHDHYLAQEKQPISIELLKEQELVLFNDEYIEAFVEHFQRLYGPLNVTVRTSSFKVVSEVMKRFQAVSLIRDIQIDDNIAEVPQEKLVGKSISHINEAVYSYGWVQQKDTEHHTVIEKFIKKFNEIKSL